MDNIVYAQKKLVDPYEEFFGEAIREYHENKKEKTDNMAQHKIITSLENSKNGEKLYFENIVQIGDMTNSGCVTSEGKICAEILDEYALTFQERNPNQRKMIKLLKHLFLLGVQELSVRARDGARGSGNSDRHGPERSGYGIRTIILSYKY